MEFLVCRLDPKAPFHIGMKEGGIEHTLHYIPSDTLFSAFCNVYRLVFGNARLEELLKVFQKNPPFLFSSVFPAAWDMPLFPVPKHVDFQRYVDEPDKRLKRVEYVSADIFRKILNDEDVTIRQEDIVQDGKVILPGFSDVSSERYDRVWEEREMPRVRLDRMTSVSEIYYFGEVIFHGGLHFLIQMRDDTYLNELETVLRVLGDEGIGGDRTYGKGLFTIKGFDTITFDGSDDAEWYVTLSLTNPCREEINGLTGFFGFSDRGGWVCSQDERNRRRNVVKMFSEGSVFNKKIVGRLVNVGEGKHSFFRYGYSFLLPVRVIS